MEASSFGENFGKLGLEKGLLQKDLARLLDVTISTIANWENDRAVPQTKSLSKLAGIFDVSEASYQFHTRDREIEARVAILHLTGG